MANKLFIPGPTEVRKEILDAMATPQIGHRTQEFKDIFGSLKPTLQELFGTKNDAHANGQICVTFIRFVSIEFTYNHQSC